MGYRDPVEALHAENESLRSQLRDAQQELDALQGAPPGASPGTHDTSDSLARLRWWMSGGCMGGLALMLPFVLMALHLSAPPSMAMSGGMTGAVAVHPTVSRGGCPLNLGHPPVGFERFTQSIERSARVTEAQNLPGVAPGTRCTVRVSPVSMQEFNCHVEVSCGATVVYGTLPTGYAHCDVDGAAPVRAMDAENTAGDGDPIMSLDLATRHLVVEDSQSGTSSRAAFLVDVPQR